MDDLRAAARGAVEGRSYDDLARAGDHLAAAANATETGVTAGLLGLILLGGLLLSRPTPPPAPKPSVPSIVEARSPADAKNPDGAKAPGKPGAVESFDDPKRGEQWVSNPNGRGNGWLESKGNVWVPTVARDVAGL